ncbi:hypothetical protein JB92DRAFT_2836835 [Gautieria morchelliformis]|nr:hypothetical protein JB92DRAFT_2836835 [Gautieria morchelliformis]
MPYWQMLRVHVQLLYSLFKGWGYSLVALSRWLWFVDTKTVHKRCYRLLRYEQTCLNGVDTLGSARDALRRSAPPAAVLNTYGGCGKPFAKPHSLGICPKHHVPTKQIWNGVNERNIAYGLALLYAGKEDQTHTLHSQTKKQRNITPAARKMQAESGPTFYRRSSRHRLGNRAHVQEQLSMTSFIDMAVRKLGYTARNLTESTAEDCSTSELAGPARRALQGVESTHSLAKGTALKSPANFDKNWRLYCCGSPLA